MVEYEQDPNAQIPNNYVAQDYYATQAQGYAQPSGMGSKLFSMAEKEENFLDRLYQFGTEQLVHTWRGDQHNTDGEWVKNESDEGRIMNEEGIRWCISTLEPFTGTNYVVTTFTTEQINQIMLPISRMIIQELSKRQREFGFKDKLDIKKVHLECQDFIYAILQGSYGDGQRSLLGKAHVHHENVYRDATGQKDGLLSRTSKNLFGGNK